MEHIFNIALVFGTVFAIGLIITTYLWFKFFPIVKSIDHELYENIRFRLKPVFKTPYSDFIFNKQYEQSPHEVIKKYSVLLY